MTQDDGSEALEVVEQARGVLFDADGTLVDTTFIHALCWWLRALPGARELVSRCHELRTATS